MANLLTTSKRFLGWAQSIPNVVIPAGLESDMQEAIAEAEAAEQQRVPDAVYCKDCGDEIIPLCPECSGEE